MVANVSNTTGLVPGTVSSVIGFRPELEGQRARMLRLGAVSVAGAIVGAVLLLVLPASAFRAIVPVFISLGVVAVLVGPRVSRLLAARDRGPSAAAGGLGTLAGIFVSGMYGGYFGAGQGLLFIAVLGIALADTLHRLNALRNVLAGLANLVAALIFIGSTHIAWGAVGLIALGSTGGGWVGVHVGRRLAPGVYRTVIAVVGIVAVVRLVT